MSVTQTQNAAYYRSLHVLADYELHHSAEPPHTEELEPHPAGETSIDGNPADWDITHNRVPAYRPTNRNLDLSTRAVYQNPVERVFVSLLFGGVYTVHLVRNLWVATGGKINDTYFRYRIGGEW